MSCSVASRSALTAAVVSASAGGFGKVAIFSSSSIDAGSSFFSAKPSPWASAVISWALIRSTRRSKCSRRRASVRAPYGDSSRTSTARSNSAAGAIEVADLELALAGLEVLLRRVDQCGDRIDGRRARRRDRRGRRWRDGGALGVCGFGLLDPQAARQQRQSDAASDGSHARIVIWALPRGPQRRATRPLAMPDALLRSPPPAVNRPQRCRDKVG